MDELEKHAKANVFPTVIRYQASTHARIFGTGGASILSKAEVVLTTYQEVSRKSLGSVYIIYFQANNVDL